MKHLFLLLFILPFQVFSQTTKKVCFLGNSYTYSNDLPGMIADLATADGNTLIKDQNTPGGYTLMGHSSNATSLTKIAADTWDYVVLQDQSQLPSFPWGQVQTDVLPYAEILVDSIRSANECAVPLFFNTWGRRDGAPQGDSINTFEKMNERLFNAYGYMADKHSGKRAPVGIGFDHIHNDSSPPVTHNGLYAGDGSHPTVYGTYLAACIFYEMIFETTCVGNTHIPSGISNGEASYLQNVANHVVNDVDSVQIDFTQPFASFSYTTNGTEVTFTNSSEHSFEWSWDFGDGNANTDEHPIHNYGSFAVYTVTLTAEYCGNSDDTTIIVNTTVGIEESNDFNFKLYPNPSNGYYRINYTGEEKYYDIWSLDGKFIQRDNLNSAIKFLPQPGIYFIKAGGVTRKLVIE